MKPPEQHSRSAYRATPPRMTWSLPDNRPPRRRLFPEFLFDNSPHVFKGVCDLADSNQRNASVAVDKVFVIEDCYVGCLLGRFPNYPERYMFRRIREGHVGVCMA